MGGGVPIFQEQPPLSPVRIHIPGSDGGIFIGGTGDCSQLLSAGFIGLMFKIDRDERLGKAEQLGL